MVFLNLKAEMARIGVEINDIALLINKNRNTVSKKLSGERAFTVPEAKKIKEKFFPTYSIEYLFNTEDNQKQAG